MSERQIQPENRIPSPETVERLVRLEALENDYERKKSQLGDDSGNTALKRFIEDGFNDIRTQIYELQQGVGGPTEEAARAIDGSINDLTRAITGAFDLLGSGESGGLKKLKERYDEYKKAA